MSHVPLEIPGFYLRTATFRMIRITYSVKTHSTIDSPALIIQKCIFQFLFAPRLAFLSTFASSCRALHPAPLFATKTLSRRTGHETQTNRFPTDYPHSLMIRRRDITKKNPTQTQPGSIHTGDYNIFHPVTYTENGSTSRYEALKPADRFRWTFSLRIDRSARNFHENFTNFSSRTVTF